MLLVFLASLGAHDRRAFDMNDARESVGDLIAAFEWIEDEVLELHAKWQIFKQLFGRSEQRIALLNDFAPDFFSIVHDSLLYDILLTISRLMDPAESGRRKNLTLHRLILMIQARDRQPLAAELAPILETLKSKYG